MIKTLIEYLKNIIDKKYEPEITEQRLQVGKGTVASLAFISLIMTCINVVQHYYLMAGTTGFFVICFLLAYVLYSKRMPYAAHRLVLISAAILFTFYAIQGKNEGFAILWMMIVPFFCMWFCGMRAGLMLQLYYLFLIVILFYTPLRAYVADYYTKTFMNRFPVLYFCNVVLSLFVMKDYFTSKKLQQDALSRAIQAEKSKSEFLAQMSHEIRTPINAVLGFDEMILRETDREDILDYATHIKTSGQTLLLLINDILDFSKIESGKMDIIPVEYDTVSLIADLLEMIAPRSESKGLAIKANIDEKLPTKLLGDDVRIRQIITNLLTNAVKYTNTGTITLSVFVNSRTNEDISLHVSVKDTGIGIKEADKERLFDSFQRVDETRNRTIEGTGLGLSITRRCLELMDSGLVLESVYGEGSDFFFDLTQKIVDETPIGNFEQVFQHRKTKVDVYKEHFYAPDAKVLVVDDIETNLLVFKGLLKNSGIQIQTAGSGYEAIKLLKHETYDLVFLDHLMPNMDGIETLANILADETISTEHMPIIALTANAISGAKEMYLQAGFTDYLTKPLNGQQLEAMLLRHLPSDKLKPLKQAGTDKSPDAQTPNHLPADTQTKSDSSQKDEPLISDDIKELIDTETGMTYSGGDTEMYDMMLQSFLDAGHDKKLEGAYQENDWNNYRIYVHGLKSASLSIGAVKLSEMAKESEFSLKNDGNIDFAEDHHEELIQLYRKTIHCVELIMKPAN